MDYYLLGPIIYMVEVVDHEINIITLKKCNDELYEVFLYERRLSANELNIIKECTHSKFNFINRLICDKSNSHYIKYYTKKCTIEELGFRKEWLLAFYNSSNENKSNDYSNLKTNIP